MSFRLGEKAIVFTRRKMKEKIRKKEEKGPSKKEVFIHRKG